MEGASRLGINLLGPCAASLGDVPLDLGGPRQRAVLALLVLARGETVPVERLAGSVWTERAPADPAGALQAYVSHLRRRLQPGSAARTRSAVIVSEGRGYAVRLPPDAVDVWRFERSLEQAGTTSDPGAAAELLTGALALWRGAPLAEWTDEPWAEAEIARLTGLRGVARERLAAARLDLGEAGLLVPDLEAMVAEEPLREERWRLLVLALYRAHRQADALGALRRARATLADELGVDPGPALRELEQQVLRQSPALTVPLQRSRATQPVAQPARPPAPRSTPRPGPVADDLLDRERELAAVRAALDDLAAGQPRLLLFEGPAGIGKTRLLTEARRLASERSVRVLTARGSQLEKAFGFGAVRQLFEPALAAGDETLLAGAAAGARAVFDPAPGEAPDGSFAVLHGLYWLAVDLASAGPLVLAVDDVQWCDSASLRWLAYLVRRLDAVPVLVVGTVRTGEPHPDEELLNELALEPVAVVVRPEALSAGAIRSLVERRLGAPASPLFVLACHRTTSGNPLLLRQLLRAMEADGVRPDAAHADTVVAVGSRAVSSMVLMRLRRLAGSAPVVARAAAVLGDGTALPVIAGLAGLPEHETAVGLARLARAEIVKDEHPPVFVHPLVREAVYRDLPGAERALLHERAARLLRDAGASDEQVAAHLLLAPVRADPDTVAVLRRAARTAAERGASDGAVTHLRRALAECPPGEVRRAVLTDLGLLESQIDGAASTEHLLQAYALHEDPRDRAELAVAIVRTEIFASPPGVATAFARETGSVVPAELTGHRQALLALERVSGYMHGLDPAIWRAPVPIAPEGTGHGARMLAATLAFEATIDGTDRERAIELARFALEADRLFAVDNGLFWVVAAAVRMLADDELGDMWQRARSEAHSRGSLFMVMSTNLWEGFWRWRRGELDEALGCLAAALDQDRMWGGAGIGEPYARAFSIGCHLDRGDVTTAQEVAEAALGGPAPGDGGRLLQNAVARVHAVQGRAAEALAVLDAAPAPLPIQNPVWNPWRSTAALALDRLGRTDEAVALVEDEVRRLRRWGAPSYLGTSLRLLGELRGQAGLPALREAVDLLATTSAAVELARARCALGSRPEIPDGEAVALLHAALDSAVERGARNIGDRARSGLAARGLPDLRGRDVPRCPTGTERAILELAGTGLGVRDVAQRLFLTPGTVQKVLESAGAEAFPVDGLKSPARSPLQASTSTSGRGAP